LVHYSNVVRHLVATTEHDKEWGSSAICGPCT